MSCLGLAPGNITRADVGNMRGFEMPLESSPHERTFMQWPVSAATYDAESLAKVQSCIALVANAIAKFEPVIILVAKAYASQARDQLDNGVEIWDIPTDDLWCRDSGPTFVVNAQGQLAVSEIKFNGWGNKQAHTNDGLIARRVAEKLGLPFYTHGLVGEQGGVEHDGAGTLLAHASSWVNPNRNKGSAEEVGELLLKALGGKKIIWAPGIIGGDITDYHIDALARFSAPGKVLIQHPEEEDSFNFGNGWIEAAYTMSEVLRESRDANGNQFEVSVFPHPKITRSPMADFVTSYVNYYVCNGAVICSEFGDEKSDRLAVEMLAAHYPGRTIVSLNTDPIGESGGGIHCATQQQPKV
jgi:agmatine deiminase